MLGGLATVEFARIMLWISFAVPFTCKQSTQHLAQSVHPF